MMNEWRDYADCAPKTNGRYLVTVKFVGKPMVYIGSYKNGAFIGEDENVVAWMPLPEAFKEKKEERDTASFPTVSPYKQTPIDYDRYGNPIYEEFSYFDYDGWKEAKRGKNNFDTFELDKIGIPDTFKLDNRGILDTIPVTC